jgi:hypothetical protein
LRKFAVWPFCLAACQLLGWSELCRAQPAAQVAQPPTASERAGAERAGERPAAVRGEAVQEVGPPVLYLRNKDGSLMQAVLGFTLEDFEKLLAQRAQLGLGQQPPSYHVENLVCTGRVADKHAALSIQLGITVEGKNWVRVPIGLGELVLREKPKYEGPGQHFLEFEEKGRQYVAWFRGASEKPHQITLDGLVPLAPAAGRTELKLSFPRATASTLKLTAPLAKAVAEVSAPAVLTGTNVIGDSTEFQVAGAAGDFLMAWQDAANRVVEAPAVLEAAGTVTASVDAQTAHCDAQLAVRSFAGPFDHFRIRLPKGAALVSGEGAGYTITTVSEEPGPSAGRGQLLEVRLRDKSLGPVTVRLVTDQPHVLVGQDRRLELEGPDVVGAVRQWGHIAVRAVGEWQIAWGQLHGLRQVDDLPQELRNEDVVAGFEYSGHPYSLAARIFPREPHRTVESKYTARIDANQVRLEATLKFNVRGGKVFALEVDAAGWQIDEIGPRTALDVDRAVVQTDLPLWLPLVQASTGEIELSLRAHRAIAADATRVEFSLPKPRAEAHAPVELSVIAADNVLLTPLEESIAGLVRLRPVREPGSTPAEGRTLHFRGDGPDPRFAADLRVQSRVVRVDVASRVMVEEQRFQVEQTLGYQIANEPLDRLMLELPVWWDETNHIEATVDGQPVELVLTTNDETSTGRGLQYSVALASKRIGSCQLLLRYTLPQERLPEGSSARISIPLVMPGDGELKDNRLSVAAPAGLTVQVQDEFWRHDETAPPPRNGLALQSTAVTTEVGLVVSARERRSPRPTVVERAWIQSWLGHDQRQDRAVFQFASQQRRLSLKLPSGVQPAQAIVVLDGVQVLAQNGSADRLSIDLPAPDLDSHHHVLDVTYRFPGRDQASGQMLLEAPQWDEGVWVRHMYWQLVLPNDEHLLVGPDDMTGEFVWSWRGLHWGRQPLRDQSQLEAWSSAEHGAAAPQASNQYVFSTLGSVATLHVRTASRSWLVLWTSGGVLLVGLLLVYVRIVRRPGVVFAAAMSLAVLAALYPDASLVVAQAAAVGLVLAVGAGYLQRELSRRRRRAVFVRTGGSSILEPPSTQSQRRMASVDVEMPAETPAAEVQISALEGLP